MKISVIICKIFQSTPHHMDKHLSESRQELLDSQFYCEKLVVLLLYTVSVKCTCTVYFCCKY